jgi:hypothetical protein
MPRNTATDTHAKRLDTISTVLFAIGVVLARLRILLQIPIVSMIVLPIDLGMYLLGYAVWLYGARVHPEENYDLKEFPYNITTLRQKVTASAVIGIIASALGFGAIFMPILMVPACIVFTISNLFWCWSEYHINQQSQKDGTRSTIKKDAQKSYFHYVLIATHCWRDLCNLNHYLHFSYLLSLYIH